MKEILLGHFLDAMNDVTVVAQFYATGRCSMRFCDVYLNFFLSKDNCCEQCVLQFYHVLLFIIYQLATIFNYLLTTAYAQILSYVCWHKEKQCLLNPFFFTRCILQ